jgi:Radical SAM superfamily
MMRFPLRLAEDLARVLITQKVLRGSRYPLVLRLDLAQFPGQSDSQTNPASAVSSRDSQALALVRSDSTPIVWIGGDTPLHYPRIGQIARDIIHRGRTVFIEMDGTLLRRRIHEFRPVSQLYLVLPLNGPNAAHDLRAGQPGNFRATIESIRTAKLSGFHVCAETTIFADTEMRDLRELSDFIVGLGLDGWIQRRPLGAEALKVSSEQMDAARNLIPSRGWRSFSELLDLTPSQQSRHCEKNKPVHRVQGEVPAHEERLGAL